MRHWAGRTCSGVVAVRRDVIAEEANLGCVLLCETHVAERQGFEPWVPLQAQRISNPPRSTTPAPLRGGRGGGDKPIKPPAQPIFAPLYTRPCLGIAVSHRYLCIRHGIEDKV